MAQALSTLSLELVDQSVKELGHESYSTELLGVVDVEERVGLLAARRAQRGVQPRPRRSAAVIDVLRS
jgi:hypothetical protein